MHGVGQYAKASTQTFFSDELQLCFHPARIFESEKSKVKDADAFRRDWQWGGHCDNLL